MKNGHLETWQVVRLLLLDKYRDYYAVSERNGDDFELRAAYSNVGGVQIVVHPPFPFSPAPVNPIPERNNWTIYNERGRKVRFKRKRKPTRVGTLLVTNHGGVRLVLGESIAPGEYDLFNRERNS